MTNKNSSISDGIGLFFVLLSIAAYLSVLWWCDAGFPGLK